MIDRPDVSVVIPCYNEEENAEAIITAAIAQLEPLGLKFEILVIDNASVDRTVEIVKTVCARDPRVRLIVNARNFGQMRSPTHAIYQARGDAVIGLCADFQDPPELIPELITRWRAGVDIVLAVRQDEEKVGFILRHVRELSYMLVSRLGDYPVIRNATGFGLYSRRVVDATKRIEEPEPFYRAMLIETGLRVETIPYLRPPRAAGETKNDFRNLFAFAMSALASSSKGLLRWPIYLGIIGLILSFALLIMGLVALLTAHSAAGLLIAAAVQAELALLFGFLGLLGDNLRIVSERTRKTPLVIEAERVNFAEVE